MCGRLFYLLSFVLVLSLVGDVQAVTVNWTDASGDHNWLTATNWDIGLLPTSADTAIIKTLPGPTIANEGALTGVLRVGAGSATGALTVDGGTLTTATNLHVGQTQDSSGTLSMMSGNITVGNNLAVGLNGSGTINMTGGTITVGGNLWIANDTTAKGHVNLDGGMITANNFQMRPQPGAVGTMNIRGGTLIINGDMLSTVQGYIDNGWITAYEGKGTLRLDYDVTNPGRTTLKAIHMLKPNPPNGSAVPVSTDQLQWTLPEPNQPGGIVTCDVYFGTNPAVEANPKIVVRRTVETASVTLTPSATYYWALDIYDSSISNTEPFMLSPVFTFNTMNQAPIVNAGADVVTWLQEGRRTGILDATVTDDGALIPYTAKWTVVSEPNGAPAAVIQTATTEDTTITLSATGRYVLQLETSDGEYTGSDTVTIDVYNDSCQAAQSVPGYQPLVGELNGDCRVDDTDMALLQENWLKDNSLTQNWFLLP